MAFDRLEETRITTRQKKYERVAFTDADGKTYVSFEPTDEYEEQEFHRVTTAPFDSLVRQACMEAGIGLDTITAADFIRKYKEVALTDLGFKLFSEAQSYNISRVVYPIAQSTLRSRESHLPGMVFMPLNTISDFIGFIQTFMGPFVALMADKFRVPIVPWSEVSIKEKTNNIFELRSKPLQVYPIINPEKTFFDSDVLDQGENSSWAMAYPFYNSRQKSQVPESAFPRKIFFPDQVWNFLVVSQSLETIKRSAYRKDFVVFCPAIRKDPTYPEAAEIDQYQIDHGIGVIPIHEILWYYQALGFNYRWQDDTNRSIVGLF